LVTVDLSEGPIDPALLHGMDAVYHLAAKTHDVAEAADADAQYTRINVTGTKHLLDAARRAGVGRVVFVSSVKAIDEGGPEARDETRTPAPSSAYGRSKLAAERLVFDAAATGAFEAVCLRFPLVYGPGQRGNLTRMIAAIDRGRFPPPPENGNRRSMLHVENAVDALVLAGARANADGRTYIVTDAHPYSTRQLYDWIRAALGRPPVRWSVPAWGFRALALGGDAAGALLRRRVGFDSDACQKLLGSAWYSPAKMIRELGYQPAQDLQGALPEIIASYRSQRSNGTLPDA
jgi:nucleoside-diphosphate-sugar epimerase